MLQLLFVNFYIALLVLATPHKPTTLRACGAVPSQEQVLVAEKKYQKLLSTSDSTRNSPAPSSIEPINVYYHFIMKDDSREGGNILDSEINAQHAVLNSNYARAGISFRMARIDRTPNADWFSNACPDTSQQTEMKKALRQGGPRDLNVYTVAFESCPLLGYSTFPSDYNDAPYDDGVVILHSSLPGGTSTNYNEGKTLTHETGHWCGLYHTFQGGCLPQGDYVDDTPPELEPTEGCPAFKDSCPRLILSTGPDPIHNYMDYSYDSCMHEFTDGQGMRMRDQIRVFRG